MAYCENVAWFDIDTRFQIYLKWYKKTSKIGNEAEYEAKKIIDNYRNKQIQESQLNNPELWELKSKKVKM